MADDHCGITRAHCPAGGEKSVDLATMVLLGLGMAMDAFAVSVSNGLAHRGRPLPCALACGMAFGLAQAAMPLLGFFAGYTFSGYIHRFDHWVALALLALLGGRMVWEARGEEIEPLSCPRRLTGRLLLGQAVATSIDALALGVSLSCIGANIWQAAAIIGGCTFLCCFVGVYLGHRFGCLLGRWAQVVGGWLLVGIGVKIFLEHTLGR